MEKPPMIFGDPKRVMNSLDGHIDPELLMKIYDLLAPHAPFGATICRATVSANSVNLEYDADPAVLVPLNRCTNEPTTFRSEMGGGWSPSKAEEVIAVLWSILAVGLFAAGLPWYLVGSVTLKALFDHATAIWYAIKESRSR